MRDIPIFTAAGGTATLVLREIPYKKMAYVIVHSTEEETQTAFFRECLDFCRAVGAGSVLLCTQREIVGWEPMFQLLRWERVDTDLTGLPESVQLIPAEKNDEAEFCSLYNTIFAGAPSAATLSMYNFAAQTRDCRTYLVQIDGQMAGVGQIREREIRCIGLLPRFRGNGTALMASLLRELGEGPVWLQVTSDNKPALRLYENMGFVRKETLSVWYDLQTQLLTESQM